ncbi:tellurite resistance TerB family protein [Maricaulis sp.]|uniref:tellurite resistance TerB family protein n=1 Tax=Maricaulis sp. TaxID=1486257 RepID=UPI0026137FD2|nr:tellurite resistance TerB family protein [Maricaulis sp.]
MIDVNSILGALQGENGRRTAMVGGGAALAGLATGMLAGKSGRKMMGKAAKYGAVAALGGLAVHALSKHKARQEQAASPAAPATAPAADYEAAQPGTPFLPAADQGEALDLRGKSLVRAMIAAAKADGTVTADEQNAIMGRLQDANLDAESRAFVEAELQRPLTLDDLVRDVTCPEHAAEVYAASLVAIDRDGAVERAYLQMLAARLGLDNALVADIHASADATIAPPALEGPAPLTAMRV